jgi:hypothetical protein
MYRWIVIIFSLTTFHGFAQAMLEGDKLKVNVLKPLFLQYQSYDEMINGKIIPGVIEIQSCSSENRDVALFAQLQIDSRSKEKADGLMSLQLSNKTSGDAVIQSVTLLSSKPSLLFVQPLAAFKKTESFFYDLILNPLKKAIPPGSYSFSIIFTKTVE